MSFCGRFFIAFVGFAFTFHASLGVGRYLLALTWLRTLTGCDITENAFSAFAAPVSEEERRIAIAAVNEATAK